MLRGKLERVSNSLLGACKERGMTLLSLPGMQLNL